MVTMDCFGGLLDEWVTWLKRGEALECVPLDCNCCRQRHGEVNKNDVSDFVTHQPDG